MYISVKIVWWKDNSMSGIIELTVILQKYILINNIYYNNILNKSYSFTFSINLNVSFIIYRKIIIKRFKIPIFK